jgi:hypothetical protein
VGVARWRDTPSPSHMGLICTCQGCGVKLDAVRKCVLFSAGFFAFVHGALLAGRVLGSSSETTAAVRNNMRTVTGDNYTDPDSLSEDDDVSRRPRPSRHGHSKLALSTALLPRAVLPRRRTWLRCFSCVDTARGHGDADYCQRRGAHRQRVWCGAPFSCMHRPGHCFCRTSARVPCSLSLGLRPFLRSCVFARLSLFLCQLICIAAPSPPSARLRRCAAAAHYVALSTFARVVLGRCH